MSSKIDSFDKFFYHNIMLNTSKKTNVGDKFKIQLKKLKIRLNIVNVNIFLVSL